MKQTSHFKSSGLSKRPRLLILAACLVLGSYLGFLIISNLQAQSALREVTLKRIRLDLEKRAASLDYFFSERKHDLSNMARSREVSAYFLNKSLGMSETYGLKVNLFVIKQLLSETIENKTVQGDPIYEQLFLIDQDEHILVDTAANRSGTQLSPQLSSQIAATDNSTQIFTDETGHRIRLVLSAPCVVKGQPSGKLVAILHLNSLLYNFVDIAQTQSLNRFDLVNNNSRLIRSEQAEQNPLLPQLIGLKVTDLPRDQFKKINSPENHATTDNLMVARFPIVQAPLHLITWAEENAIFGALTPWQLLLGPGILVLILLASIIKIVQFNTEKLVLQAHVDESQKRQKELSSKNQQLNDEMLRRQRAEDELEVQRSLSIRTDRLRSLGEMAAGIAHELNQPLTGVRGMAELILMYSNQQSKPQQQQKIVSNAQTIVDQADRMVHIIDHIRLFARDAGKVETSRADLNDIITSAVSLISAQFGSHDISLVIQLSPFELLVQINPFSVEEVVLNLLTNARDAIDSKRLSTAADYKPVITIRSGLRTTKNETEAWLEVNDNGNGISRHAAEKIFDPFFTTKDPDKGTGLGLSISKSIVEEMTGSIYFTSKTGEGATFTIQFPLCPTTEDDACT